MKFILSILVLFLSTKECSSKKTINSSQDDLTIIYEANSRGFFEEIKISKGSISYCNDMNRNNIDTYSITQDEWEDCLQLLSQIDLKSLPLLEAPTTKRYVDGAANATLTIINGEEVTKSNTFDHGYPPSSIKALVEKLISIKNLSIKK